MMQNVYEVLYQSQSGDFSRTFEIEFSDTAIIIRNDGKNGSQVGIFDLLHSSLWKYSELVSAWADNKKISLNDLNAEMLDSIYNFFTKLRVVSVREASEYSTSMIVLEQSRLQEFYQLQLETIKFICEGLIGNAKSSKPTEGRDLTAEKQRVSSKEDKYNSESRKNYGDSDGPSFFKSRLFFISAAIVLVLLALVATAGAIILLSGVAGKLGAGVTHPLVHFALTSFAGLGSIAPTLPGIVIGVVAVVALSVLFAAIIFCVKASHAAADIKSTSTYSEVCNPEDDIVYQSIDDDGCGTQATCSETWAQENSGVLRFLSFIVGCAGLFFLITGGLAVAGSLGAVGNAMTWAQSLLNLPDVVLGIVAAVSAVVTILSAICFFELKRADPSQQSHNAEDQAHDDKSLEVEDGVGISDGVNVILCCIEGLLAIASGAATRSSRGYNTGPFVDYQEQSGRVDGSYFQPGYNTSSPPVAIGGYQGRAGS